MIGHAQPRTLGDVILPAGSAAESMAAIVAMSWAIGVCAQISIPLPFTPVPITLSTLGVLYAGALLGPSRGAAAVLLYLLEGSLGLPFFAGGAAGWVHFFGPTGGYLLGFIPAAWMTGVLARRGWDREPVLAVAMMLLGAAIIFGGGLFGLARFVPRSQLLMMGFYPFVIGDLAKSCFGAAFLPLGWKIFAFFRARN